MFSLPRLNNRSSENKFLKTPKQAVKTENYECTLSAELLEKAKKELNEDPARRTNDIEALRSWIIKQRHIHGRTDDAFLLRFLRNCKFSIERAKEKIDKFYTLKTALPEWFTGMDVSDPMLLDILKSGVMVPIGNDREGRRIVISRPGTLDPSKYKIDMLFKVTLLISEYVLMDEQAQICGTILLSDMNGVGPVLASQFTPTMANKILTVFQDAMPVRVKTVHYINTPAIFDVMFPIAKTFMKSKMLQRFHLHGSKLESLHAEIPPEFLPTEYGGTAGDFSTFIDEIVKAMLELREHFLDDEQYNVNESKRPGKPKTKSDLFGVDGTFRKLTID